MKELNAAELAQVSGAGIIADLGGVIGGAIGSIVDSGAALGGYDIHIKDAVSTLGKGIGSIFELNFADAFVQISRGISDIVSGGSNWELLPAVIDKDFLAGAGK